VSRAAGSARPAQWVRREADGGGTALPGEMAASRLGPEAFPELLLREDWPRADDAELVADYLAWQAPRLLTLPRLSEATRARLERSARSRALAVERLWRLFPRVIDPTLIEQARVEARIRRSRH
jgi:hypothetical protein